MLINDVFYLFSSLTANAFFLFAEALDKMYYHVFLDVALLLYDQVLQVH